MGFAAVVSSTAVVFVEGSVEITEDAPPLYMILPGRYWTDEPLRTPLWPPTGVQVWLATFIS